MNISHSAVRDLIHDPQDVPEISQNRLVRSTTGKLLVPCALLMTPLGQQRLLFATATRGMPGKESQNGHAAPPARHCIRSIA
jgi:hypothetical protein